MIYERLIRPMLFSMDAERSHDWVLKLLNHIPSFFFTKASGASVRAMGLNFPHPLGLAAGLDKNGDYIQGLGKLGFSFLEIGTVTPKPQEGNPKPRLFRLEEDKAIINRMGFNNHGVEMLVSNLEKARFPGIIGINIGKNKDTPLNKAAVDYRLCLEKVYPYASYVTINISSPNTPDLRQLQQSDYLASLLNVLVQTRKRLSDTQGKYVPLVVKVSPDESEETLILMAETFLAMGIDGIIATNTTCSREKVPFSHYAREQGGLSGEPLFDSSTSCLKFLKSRVGEDMTLIGLGGIFDAKTARDKLDAGASLIQIYTGLIYQGPWVIPKIVSAL